MSTPFGAYIMITPVIHGLKSIQMKEIPAGANIMVLGGGCHENGNSAAEHLSTPSLKRLLEAYRIWKLIPESNLILSGTDWHSQCNIAALSADLIYLWKKDTSNVIQLNPVMNTREEAAMYLKRFGNQKPLVLVSSALHIPRAIRNFKAVGINVLAAPTDFPMQDYHFSFYDFFPSPEYFQDSSSAWMEWVAWIAGK